MSRRGEERQAHGFTFEDFVVNHFNLKQQKNYTSEWDARASDGIAVSIKTSNKNNDIMFGDIFRQANVNEKTFIIVIGFWGEHEYDLKETYAIKMHSLTWKSLFSKDAMSAMDKLMALAGNGNYHNSNDKAKWDMLSKEAKVIWERTTPNIMKPRFRWSKPGSSSDKSTHRIQCGMRYKEFEKNILKNKHIKVNKYDLADEYVKFIKKTGGQSLINYMEATAPEDKENYYVDYANCVYVRYPDNKDDYIYDPETQSFVLKPKPQRNLSIFEMLSIK